jgi:hypothetical protein
MLNIIGFKKSKPEDHVISYADCLQRTGMHCIEAIVRRRRLQWAGNSFEWMMNDDRLPKLFGELDIEGPRPKGRPRVNWKTCLTSS